MKQLCGLRTKKTLIKAKWCLIICVTAIVVLGSIASALAVPSIKITKLSPYGDLSGTVEGTVSGVNYSDYYLAAYIKVDEAWWTKPYLLTPRCTINLSNGTFVCDITTGGCDIYATAIALQLMPIDKDPISCFPCLAKPKNPAAVAFANTNRPYPRTLAFSGYKWRVKKAPDCKLGPGGNYFSDASNDIWVDGKGLHLRISKDPIEPDKWYSSEVVLQQSLGYGTYIFHTNSRVDILDPNIVAGLYTWDGQIYYPSHRELDIEFARWGNSAEPTNAQFVVQPCSQCPGCANCSRYSIDLTDKNKYITTYMIWAPNSVEFRAYKGQYWDDNPPESALIHKWTKNGSDVPPPSKENIRLNFWLFKGSAPVSGQNSELIVENFVFRPLCAP